MMNKIVINIKMVTRIMMTMMILMKIIKMDLVVFMGTQTVNKSGTISEKTRRVNLKAKRKKKIKVNQKRKRKTRDIDV